MSWNSSPEERVLDVLAVAEEPLNITRISKVAATSTKVARAALEKHADAWDIYGDRNYLGTAACSQDRGEALLESGEYGRIASDLNMVSGWHHYTYGSALRDLRMAIHARDDATLQRGMHSARLPSERWFLPVRASQMAKLSTYARTAVLGDFLTAHLHNLAEPEGLTEYLHTLPINRQPLFARRVLAFIHWMRTGDTQALEAIKDSDWARAFVLLLKGNLKPAVKTYASAIAAYRKQHGNDVIPSLGCAHFLPLAYALDGTKSRTKQLASWMKRADKQHITSHAMFEGWLHVALLADPEAQAPATTHPIALLLEKLTCHWRDQPPPEHLDAGIAKAKELGWSYLAEQLEHPTGGVLGALRGKRSVWEDRLTQLELLSGSPPKAAPATKKRRLAWFVAYELPEWIDLTAVLQSSTKTGWTKGKVVALERLAGKGKPVEPLTREDSAVARALRSRTYNGWYGRETKYSWDMKTALLALADHPAVFEHHSRRPLPIVKRSPSLSVTKQRGETTVTIEPHLPEGWLAEEVGDGLEITVATRRQLELIRKVGDGLSVPKAGEKRLNAWMDSVADVFPAQQSAAEHPGDPRAYAVMRPVRGAIDLEPVVRPLGTEHLQTRPGKGASLALSTLDGKPVRVVRDLKAERHHLQTLLDLDSLEEAAFDGVSRWRIEDPAHVLAFLADAADAEIPVLWPEGGELKFLGTARSTASSLSVAEVKDWFEATGSFRLGETDVSLVELVEASLRSEGRFVQLRNKAWVALEGKLRKTVDSLARIGTKKKDAIRVHPLAANALSGLSEHAEVPESFTQQLASLQSLPARVPVPPALSATLRPYQLSAFRWMAALASVGAGALLADDMGLGKTVTTLALLLHSSSKGPSLVVAPTSVAGNWQREVRRFAPTLSVHRLGASSDRSAVLDKAGAGDLVICSYGILVSEAEALAAMAWNTVVLDESQAIKNPATQRHKAAKALTAKQVVALTGTPVENHLGELHAQFEILLPGFLPGKKPFRDRYAKPIEQGNETVAAQLRKVVRPFITRRTKGEVLDDLPPKTEVELLVDLSEAEAVGYELLREEATAKLGDDAGAIAVLAQLTRLRQFVCNPRLVTKGWEHPSSKELAFRRLVGDLMAGGHRALVFSQFVGHLSLLRSWLDTEGIAYAYLDGSTPAAARDKAVASFQGGELPLFLISLKAGGTGLTLTAADYVIHMDPWWNPAVEDQASDRAHRIGQERPVTVYRLVAANTVEQKILQLHASKRDLADGILEGSDAASRLDAQALRGLLVDAAEQS